MNHFRLLSLLACLVMPATAEVTSPYLTMDVGQVGIDKSLDNRTRYGLEYRFQPTSWHNLVPAIGLAKAELGASFIYIEFKRDFFLNNHWLLTPSFGAGAFNESDELALGQELEFRSGLRLSYQFTKGYRVGLALFHLSNGGLSDENPGTEAITLSLSLPIN